MNIGISNIVTAFDEKTIGSKVINSYEFIMDLSNSIREFQELFLNNGQALIPLKNPDNVSCGIALRSGIPLEGFHAKLYRDEVSLYAKRNYALKADHISAVVYTIQAYKADPQVSLEEVKELEEKQVDYVLVAVLASVGPKPPMGSGRFVRNLAGGNNRYKSENGYTLEQAITEAQEIVSYEQRYITVAD
jgi:hypothetical protein